MEIIDRCFGQDNLNPTIDCLFGWCVRPWFERFGIGTCFDNHDLLAESGMGIHKKRLCM